MSEPFPVMTAEQAAGAARAIKPKVAVPMHYGAIVGSEADAVRFGKLLENKSANYGYDAQKGEYTDLVKAGIIDPTKVVRCALQDAASVAGLLITTEAMVAELPKKKEAMPAMPPGGGMDF